MSTDTIQYENGRPKKSGLGFKIFKYAFKTLAMILVFGTTVFFLWRVFSSGNPKSMEGLVVNEAVHKAYLAAGEDMVIYSQEQDHITRAEHNYSYFAVTDVKFVEEANQVQVLFRYNNGTIRHLKEDYNLAEMPARDEDLYDVTLYVAYDITPADKTDNDGNDPESVRFVRYHATSHTADQKNLYNYRKFIFDGVDMTVTDNPVLAVYVDVYYKGDVNYERDAYGTLIIYDYATERIPYELGKKDKEALAAFGK